MVVKGPRHRVKLSRGIVGADLYCFVPGFDKFLSHLACRKVSIVFSHTVLGGWVDGWGLGHSVLLRELGQTVSCSWFWTHNIMEYCLESIIYQVLSSQRCITTPS